MPPVAAEMVIAVGVPIVVRGPLGVSDTGTVVALKGWGGLDPEVYVSWPDNGALTCDGIFHPRDLLHMYVDLSDPAGFAYALQLAQSKTICIDFTEDEPWLSIVGRWLNGHTTDEDRVHVARWLKGPPEEGGAE